jgi:hypothetical protein
VRQVAERTGCGKKLAANVAERGTLPQGFIIRRIKRGYGDQDDNEREKYEGKTLLHIRHPFLYA